MKHGKNYRNALKKYDSAALFSIPRAVELVKELKFAKFDETVEVHVSLKLGKNQSVRDTVVLPHQFRGEKRVLVFCKEDRVKEALEAGAAYAGAAEYIEKVKGGWLDFDIAVATPDMMKDVGRLGMVLGRKGLMPNPKTGTVTAGVVHLAIGKVSMDTDKIAENITILLTEIGRKKPADAKADFIQSVSISSTMGPGVWLDYKVGE